MDIITLAQESSLKELAKIRAPHVKVSWSNLGGIPSVFLHVSCETKEQWAYDIYHNSPYSIFYINEDMKLEQISHHYLTTKHRKCKIKSVEDVITKVEKWVKENTK